ncbi:hypothetical protein IGI37_002145 [Enterococcus sp. AZ194]|uniref:hypothetical protein n=1 Tax=Enterococcus sp. AZ194 TaxID=2774629 RepID=UPI003F1EF559
MGIFARLFKKEETPVKTTQTASIISTKDEMEEGWTTIPAYIDANAEDYQLVSLIATAIAAGDQPDKQFVVKKIKKRNPEAKLVSLIASSIAAGTNENSQFVVRRMAKK